LGGTGETTKLTSGARVAVTEEEGVAAGLRKLEEEVASGNYAKAAQAGMGGGLRGRVGRLAAGPFWAENEEKFFSE
jgi:hypothetical protein